MHTRCRGKKNTLRPLELAITLSDPLRRPSANWRPIIVREYHAHMGNVCQRVYASHTYTRCASRLRNRAWWRAILTCEREREREERSEEQWSRMSSLLDIYDTCARNLLRSFLAIVHLFRRSDRRWPEN